MKKCKDNFTEIPNIKDKKGGSTMTQTLFFEDCCRQERVRLPIRGKNSLNGKFLGRAKKGSLSKRQGYAEKKDGPCIGGYFL